MTSRKIKISVQPIDQCGKDNNTVPKLFSDDTNIFIFHKTKDASFKIANKKLDSLANWLLANKLSLSVGIDRD